MKIFFWESKGAVLWRTLLLPACLILGAAFWYFSLYAAVVFLAGLTVLILLDYCHFIVLTDEDVREIRMGRVWCRIPLDEITRLNVQAGKPVDSLTIQGENDLIIGPYRKKTFQAMLAVIGTEENVMKGFFLDEPADQTTVQGEWTYRRETVYLDELFSKKKFVHREAWRAERPKEKEETDREEMKNAEGNIPG